MKETLKPFLDQLRVTIANRDEIRENLVKNLAQTRSVLEITAKEVVRQTKESRLFVDYVRPAVESSKTEDALNRLENKLTQAGPLVTKLKQYRNQFLDATKPSSNGSTHEKDESGHVTKAKRRKGSKSTVTESKS